MGPYKFGHLKEEVDRMSTEWTNTRFFFSWKVVLAKKHYFFF